MTPIEKIVLVNLIRGLEYALDNLTTLNLLRIRNIICLLITEIKKELNGEKENNGNE